MFGNGEHLGAAESGDHRPLSALSLIKLNDQVRLRGLSELHMGVLWHKGYGIAICVASYYCQMPHSVRAVHLRAFFGAAQSKSSLEAPLPSRRLPARALKSSGVVSRTQSLWHVCLAVSALNTVLPDDSSLILPSEPRAANFTNL